MENTLDMPTDRDAEFTYDILTSKSSRFIEELYLTMVEAGVIYNRVDNTDFDSKLDALADYFMWNVDELEGL